jgi:hypothetical protein
VHTDSPTLAQVPLLGNTQWSYRARVRRLLRETRDDPAAFQTAILGRSLWSKQVEVCNAVARYPVTVVPAGRAVGKSYLLAGLVLWWLYTRPGSLVIATAPDHRSIATILWKELRRALRPRQLGDARLPRVRLGYHQLSDGSGSPLRLEVQKGSDWGALGFAAAEEEGFSGQHAGELLVIVDEASGIRAPIWSAIHGLAATRLVVAGNPIRYDCHFRELYELAQDGTPDIAAVTISSLESPHAQDLHSPVGLACKSFLQRMATIHGPQSPWYAANILGRFPGQESVRFIPSAWLDACTNENIKTDPLWIDYRAGDPWLGVDVAGGVGADRSAIVVRNRRQILEIFASQWHGVLDDARHRLEPEVVRLARQWGVPGSHVIFDQSGLGRSFGSYLRNHGLEDAVGYFGAGKGGRLHVNRRTANAYALHRRLDPGRAGHVPFYCGGLPAWPALREELDQLKAPTMEMEEGQVKQSLEPKEHLAARLGRSPDLLDALLMTFTYLD